MYADGSGTVNFDEDFQHLLEKHVKSVEDFGNDSFARVEVKSISKSVEPKTDHALVGKPDDIDRDEQYLNLPKLYSNKNGHTETKIKIKPEVTTSESVERIVTKYSEWTASGMFSAKYQGSGGQLGFGFKKGKSTTDKQSLTTQIKDSFDGELIIPPGEERTAGLINELFLKSCKLQNAKWCFDKSAEVSCDIYLTNSDKKGRKYKLRDVLKERRVHENEFSFWMNGKYEWVFIRQRIKDTSTS